MWRLFEGMKKICKRCGRIYRTYEKKRKYCSQKCYWNEVKDNPLEKHNRWKGGRHVDTAGYVTLQVKSGMRVREHRFIMEKYLGRKLNKSELVHHINQDRTDNKINNLKVVSRAEHNKIHNMGICV